MLDKDGKGKWFVHKWWLKIKLYTKERNWLVGLSTKCMYNTWVQSLTMNTLTSEWVQSTLCLHASCLCLCIVLVSLFYFYAIYLPVLQDAFLRLTCSYKIWSFIQFDMTVLAHSILEQSKGASFCAFPWTCGKPQGILIFDFP